jgi:hypothetical protein
VYVLFQTYVASVLFGCCKSRSECYIYMQVFQVFPYVCCNCFHLDVVMLCNDYPHAFKFFLMFCKCFSCFGHMLRVFYLDGIKVIVCCTYWMRPTCCSCGAGHLRVVWETSRQRKTSRRRNWGAGKRTSRCGHPNPHVHPDVWADFFIFNPFLFNIWIIIAPKKFADNIIAPHALARQHPPC